MDCLTFLLLWFSILFVSCSPCKNILSTDVLNIEEIQRCIDDDPSSLLDTDDLIPFGLKVIFEFDHPILAISFANSLPDKGFRFEKRYLKGVANLMLGDLSLGFEYLDVMLNRGCKRFCEEAVCVHSLAKLSLGLYPVFPSFYEVHEKCGDGEVGVLRKVVDEMFWLVKREADHISSTIPNNKEMMYSPLMVSSFHNRSSEDDHMKRDKENVFFSHLMISSFLDEVGYWEASISHISLAASISPTPPVGFYSRILFSTASVTDNEKILREVRRKRRREVRGILKRLDSQPTTIDWNVFPPFPDLHFTITPASMMIGYQNLGDEEMMRSHSTLLSSLIQPLSSSLIHQPNLLEDPNDTHSNQKIRITVVSSFLENHTVSHLFLGLLKGLDREIFDMIFIPLSHFFPPPTSSLEGEKILSPTSHTIPHLSSLIISTSPNIIIYPELGMDMIPLLLSHLRLAPLQMVLWGHPFPQFSPEIDFFLSSSLFHDDITINHDKSMNWGEQVVLMDSSLAQIPSKSEVSKSDSKMEDTNLEDWLDGKIGLINSSSTISTIFLLPHSIMKLHPSMDIPILNILNQTSPDSILISVYKESQKGWRGRWLKRLHSHLNKNENYKLEDKDHEKKKKKNYHPSIQNRIFSIPYLPKDQLFSLYKSDKVVVVDGFVWGMGLTAMEAFLHSCPVLSLVDGNNNHHHHNHPRPHLVKGWIETMDSEPMKPPTHHQDHHPDQMKEEEELLKDYLLSSTTQELVEKAVELHFNSSKIDHIRHLISHKYPILSSSHQSNSNQLEFELFLKRSHQSISNIK